MTLDTASIPLSLHPAKDVDASQCLSGGFFDYDELDKAYAALTGEAVETVETSGGEDEDGLDSLSEVWPGDLPGFGEVEDDLPDLVPGPMEQGPMVWEVCVLRLLVRKAPDLSAPVQGICHERELLFEEHAQRPDDSPEDWLCLDGQSGYVLKDGSRKDSRLGMLVKPFKLQGVPPDYCPSVLLTLKDGWRKARSSRPGVPLLRPNAVGKLRQLAEDAVSAASTCGGFDLDIFESEYQKGVETVRSEQGFFAQARSLLQKAERAAKPQSTRQYLPRFGLHQESVHRWIEGMRQRILPNQADASEVVGKAAELLRREENMVKLQVPVGSAVHVVGDLHGQFWDLLHLLEMCGDPSPRNQYLFNGDFVDRGQFSVEVAFLLLALKVCYPRAVHLNRGNHEATRMNALYGFLHETEEKYSNELFRLFSDAFTHLPLCTLVNDSVFVVHGGLSSKDGVKLSEIQQLNRLREPDETADQLMLDLLWSDPMDQLGRLPSPRGGGVLFGPDVTERFCEDNGLCCIIRSHEMKPEGFEWQHMNRCLTIFSAPNYCDVCGNLGAVCDITPSQARKVTVDELHVRTFECSPHPDEPHRVNMMFRPY